MFRLAFMQAHKEITEIAAFIRQQIGDRTPVIAISGGIDSALTLMLLRKVYPAEKIMAFFLPDDRTPEKDYMDVEALSKVSGVKIHTINIQPMVASFQKTLEVSQKEALGNIKSRVRMITLYYHSNLYGGMVVGTTNRSEYVVGYYTKFGDGACDVEPILHLLKRDVRELSRALNVPDSIISKEPSAGLWESQTDESELGMSYDVLDQIIEDIFDRGSQSSDPLYEKVRELYRNSAHKRRGPISKV